MTARTFAVVDTPDGPFALLADPDGAVVASGWTADLDALLARLPERERGVDVVSGASEHTAAVEAFYAGEVAAIDTVPVRQWGTPLQQRGWAGLRAIAAGHPLTYAEFAVALGSPTAVRAAASICARNAPALFVPCHRVLRTGGAMGGFVWGVEVKRSLLAREAAAR